ncbi:MBL fold metallo-hydrolase [Natrialba swarupiae]|uniref:MBL fold metallo-hydrolase n=1 Tax=Natrialba swarupiae TaxID=2448032 RepID=A0A5D5ANW5_9EURY|nr:MBL fold metallo-hydrolase [Natrialba swarupiae]TYT61442.1 MBL fold metallo-hydrolase [Natrialba swarupiae]
MRVTRHPVETTTRAPTGSTNAYLVGTDPAMLVDPAGRTDELDRAVAERGVEHVLLTHTHSDHVGAVDAYAAETGATVWARRGHVDRFRDATGRSPDRTVSPETSITLGDDAVRVLEAAGHAPDHVALVAGQNGPILCGDCAVRDGSVVVGTPEGDIRAYVRTLRRLWTIDPPTLFPGHGPVVDAPRETLERLLEHRARRERRVLAAVDSGAQTLEEILGTAYEKDLSGVYDLAEATVVCHLETLDAEGRLAWDGKRARPIRNSKR